MSSLSVKLGGADTDNAADEIINSCLNPNQPQSFFLFAGAGSGKTRSLKSALEQFRESHGTAYRRAAKKIAVITFTNAAVEEISERVGADALFPISTIHSFCWKQIDGFHTDIRAWLLAQLPIDLAEIQAKHAKGRAGKAAEDRIRAMAAISQRIEWLQEPRRFVYNPNGNNFGAASLSHTEVIKITASFLRTKVAMQAALIDHYPFLLVDESQDTNKDLLNALFELAKTNVGRFGLGLFGDTMQRIYSDGQARLGKDIPPDWAQPQKQMNHRSVQRVVKLANMLRADADGREQLAREDSEIGVVRLFIGSDTAADKPALEGRLRSRMAEVAADPKWAQDELVKTLTLEHHMAAARCGFLPMFKALDNSSTLSTGLRSGELAGLRLFTQCVVPLFDAFSADNKFAALNILRTSESPLLVELSSGQSVEQNDPLKAARQAVNALMALLNSGDSVTFLEVLQCIAEYGLFEIPSSLRPFVSKDSTIDAIEKPPLTSDEHTDQNDEDNESPSSLTAWREFLETPYIQIIPYAEYLTDEGPYGTHQGVKGLQFDRVLVIIDDNEAKGFLFSYGKLFGMQPLTDNDRQKAAQGEDTGNDRTRRLLYVTCTRARKSLALVMYTNQRESLADFVVKRGWFQIEEVELID